MYRKSATAVLVTMLMAGSALASPQPENSLVVPPSDVVLAETDAAAIVQQQTQIRTEAQAQRGRYSEMPIVERDRLLKAQERVFARLEGRTLTTELSQSDQRALFNDLEEISALVNKAEDERMICERSRPIGSNRPVSVCKTVAQRREERERGINARGGRDSRCGDGSCPDNGTFGWR